MINSKIRYLAPLQPEVELFSFCQQRLETTSPFSTAAYEFVDALSNKLLRNASFKSYPEMVALGYWLRRANIIRITKSAVNHTSNASEQVLMPRGLVFHVAPSNVDTIFIYSLVISLLLGNKNLVRLSSKSSTQQKLILDLLNDVIASVSNNTIARNLLVITYDHDDDISRFITSHCDARMLWGGDGTVGYFSGIPLKPTAVDIKFANKYSMSVIDAASLLNADNDEINKLAALFVNDTYLFGQQACSSPRAVCLLGQPDITKEASKIFWQAIQSKVNTFAHDLSAADYVEKLIYSAVHSIQNQSTVTPTDSMQLTLIKTNLSGLIDSVNHCGRGTFLESSIESLTELNSYLDRRVQTLTYYGVDKSLLFSWLSNGVSGIDRVVPIGQGLDFDYIWDGVNLFTSLSRIVTIK